MIIFTLIVAGLAFWIGIRWQYRQMINTMTNHPDRMINALHRIKRIVAAKLTDDEDVGTEITVENIGNTWYLYCAEDQSFLAQGDSLHNALENLHERFPNQNFWGGQEIIQDIDP